MALQANSLIIFSLNKRSFYLYRRNDYSSELLAPQLPEFWASGLIFLTTLKKKIIFCLLTLLTLFRSGLSVLLQRDLLLSRLPGPGDIILLIVILVMMMIIMVVIKTGPGDRGYDCCARTKQRGKWCFQGSFWKLINKFSPNQAASSFHGPECKSPLPHFGSLDPALR